MFTTTHPPATPEELRALIKKFNHKNSFLDLIRLRFKSSAADRKLIRQSYLWNAELFAKILRQSGGPYMEGHLVPVAVLLLEYWLVMDAEMIAAALTHDSLEDFPDQVSRELIAESQSEEVARLVFGVTKPPLKGRAKNSVAYSHAVISRAEAHGENCVFLKCNADRLHNMLTLWGSPAKKRWKIWETQQYFLPLARRFEIPTAELQLAIAEQKKRLHIDDTQ
jgi:(p)ppGpp synthase/HD superfamily hydrolase